MYLPRHWIGTLLILILMVVNAGLLFVGVVTSLIWPVILLLIIDVFLISRILRWTANAPVQPVQSRRKVEKVLRDLDDEDLDLLRSRLMRDDTEDERDYSSMAELVQSGKRKNEVR